MTQALYTALTALRSQQYGIDTIANNLANVNTTGYQAWRVNFSDALYAQMRQIEEAEANLQAGAGALVAATGRSTTDGAAVQTDRNLDFMVSGNAYFTVGDGAGNTYYTRDGAFQVSQVGATNYLTTADGYFVLDANGQPITLPNSTGEGLAVDKAGNLSMGTTALGQLGLATFVNPEGLSAVGGSKFAATVASGAAAPAGEGVTVAQGALEGSNVDMSQEMSLLLQSQRLYSMLGRSITTADEMDATANSLVR